MKSGLLKQLIFTGMGLTAGLGAALLANAETLVVDDQLVVEDSNIVRPDKGQTMNAVEAKFGAPQARHEAVGKPPITRWDYPNFVVFFEHEHVIHAVALNH